MRYAGTCSFCRKPVAARQAAYLVTGWETARAGGGANRIWGASGWARWPTSCAPRSGCGVRRRASSAKPPFSSRRMSYEG